MDRRTLREKAVQALFQVDRTGISAEQALENLRTSRDEDEETMTEEDASFLQALTEGATREQDRTDPAIQTYLKRWSLSRLSAVDRSILRLAAYELICRSDIPGKVSVNEAVELAKRYSTESSRQYINGVLSNLYQEQNEEENTVEKGDSGN